MKDQLGNIGIEFVEILAPVVLALVGVLVKKAIDWLNAKTKNEQVKGLLQRLEEAAMTAVTEVEQTVIRNLRPGDPKTTLDKARETALRSMHDHLGPKGLADLRKTLGNDDAALQRLMESYIEAKVFQVKEGYSARPGGWKDTRSPMPPLPPPPDPSEDDPTSPTMPALPKGVR